jgi:hypothetical protein
MKSVNGKKFCEQCQKHVYDVRRKSPEKIVQLKKGKGECCLIIYEDQLEKVQRILSNEKNVERKRTSVLPYAAGLAALSLLPQISNAQTNNSPVSKEIHDENGKKVGEKKLTEIKSVPQGKKEIVIKGTVISSYKKIGKGHDFELGYYVKTPNGSSYVKVLDFSSKMNGSFSFKLNEQQLKSLNENDFEISCDDRSVSWEKFDFSDYNKHLIIEIRKRGRVMGAYAFYE